MRHTIETAPRDGKVVILEDDPTRDGYLPQEHDEPSTASEPGSSSRARRLATACWITVTLIAAASICLYFGFEHATPSPSEESRKTESLMLRQQAEASAQSLEQDRQKTAAIAREATAARQELTASTEQHRQALEDERARSAALASELATAQREIETQAALLRKASEETRQLEQAEAANSARLLEQEREKVAALAQEAAAARQELITNTAQHRQALDEERARRAALWSELATAQREIETQAALLRKASEETGQLEQAEAANSARLLEQEPEKTVALAQGTAAVRQELTTSTAKYHLALDEKRARSAALTRELATAQRHNARQSWRAMLWLWGLPDTGAASRAKARTR